jgi:hypothetical protein
MLHHKLSLVAIKSRRADSPITYLISIYIYIFFLIIIEIGLVLNLADILLARR